MSDEKSVVSLVLLKSECNSVEEHSNQSNQTTSWGSLIWMSSNRSKLMKRMNLWVFGLILEHSEWWKECPLYDESLMGCQKEFTVVQSYERRRLKKAIENGNAFWYQDSLIVMSNGRIWF